MSAVEVAAAALLLLGAALALLAGVGLNRFDSVYARIHAATKAVTLGLLLVLIGSALLVGDLGDVAKLALVGVLQLVTAPVAAHMLGRAAHRTGEPLGQSSGLDELAGRDDDGATPT